MSDKDQSTINKAGEYKGQKKAWNKGRRKTVRPFKGLTFLFVILAVVFSAVIMLVNMLPTTFDMVIGQTRYSVSNTDDSAVYYESDFDSDEERIEAGAETSETVEAEGASLLLNEDDALPLAEGSKVTLFSHSCVDPVFGGTGSAVLDTSEVGTFKSALEEVGIEVNSTMWDFYETGAGSEYERISADTEDLVLNEGDVYYGANEVPLDVYTDTEWDSVEEYGDAAIMLISRVGGEGYDLPASTQDNEDAGYLGLSQEEFDLLDKLQELKDAGTIDKIIILLNSSNTIELSFLDDYDIDAILNVGGMGTEGLNAVADILVGNVNPSGRLSDTYLADNDSSPAMVNYDANSYTNAEEAGLDDATSYYVAYAEGIYIGYHYYETIYEDYVMGTGNTGDYDYYSDVAFSFGTGLSYTEFEYSDFSVEYDEAEDQFVVTVTVTNVGDVAGKHTVMVYSQSPYTEYDEENGVEKSSVELVGFDKTESLEPGASETVTIYVDKSDIASYDTYGYGTYIMDAGTYYLTIAEDAHEAVNNFLAAKGYTPENTDGRMDDEGSTDMIYSWEEAELDAVTYSTSDNGTTIENQLSSADVNLNESTGDQTITYLSRSDWQGTWPVDVELTATDEMVADLAYQLYDADTYDGVYADATMPTLGADNGLSLIDLQGLDYDDPLWDDLLDQLTAEDMAYVIGTAFHYTMGIESINMPGTRDENGPTGLTTGLFGDFGDLSDYDVMGLPSEDIMGATFNTDLMTQVGEMIGEDCLAANVTFLYGPGANTHRTSYYGRNYEYYSEDSFLAGKMCAAECAGVESNGVHVMIKHFALNDMEDERIGLGVWANEQTIRETYLAAFQYALSDTETLAGVMSSYSRVGTTVCGSSEGLMTGILRGEWGCTGVVISDNSGNGGSYMNAMDGLLAGHDIWDAMLWTEYDQLQDYLDDPVIVSAMRDAIHRVAYAILNSQAMNGITTDSSVNVHDPAYLTFLKVGRIVSILAAIACLVLWQYKKRVFKRANPKPKKNEFVGAADKR